MMLKLVLRALEYANYAADVLSKQNFWQDKYSMICFVTDVL